MAQNLLVDTGLMNADKLFRYMQTDEAVRDLIENRIDVVIVGQATASYYGSRQDLRVAGKGFEQQNLAIAMRAETPRLKAEIHRVMDEMLIDGTIWDLFNNIFRVTLPGSYPRHSRRIHQSPPPYPLSRRLIRLFVWMG